MCSVGTARRTTLRPCSVITNCFPSQKPPAHLAVRTMASEMWQPSELGRQMLLTVTAILRGQGQALTHTWAACVGLGAAQGHLG